MGFVITSRDIGYPLTLSVTLYNIIDCSGTHHNKQKHICVSAFLNGFLFLK